MTTVHSIDPNNPLFKKRTPEAAARQLAVVLAWLTECDLATLEHMEGKKTTKYELQRQRKICDDAVQQCWELGVQPRGLNGHSCTRLMYQYEELAAQAHNRHQNEIIR